MVLSPTDPQFATKLYSQFGNSWRIKQAESLFDYQPGESTATFTNLSIPSAIVTVASIPAAAMANAQAVCLAAGVRTEPLLDDCLIDVGMTGQDIYAASTAAVAAAGGLGASPSGSPSPGQVTPISIGQAVSGTIASTTEQADYTFTGTAGQAVYPQAHGDCAGTLTWDLLAPGGGDLAGSLTCHDLERVDLSSEGTYTIRVNGEHSGTGTYSFTVLAVPATVVTPVQLGGDRLRLPRRAPARRRTTRSARAARRRSTSSTVRRARRRSSGSSSPRVGPSWRQAARAMTCNGPISPVPGRTRCASPAITRPSGRTASACWRCRPPSSARSPPARP